MIPEHMQEGSDAIIPVGNHNELTSRSWEPAPGEHVEVRRSGREVRQGVIEAVMRDNTGFWLAADGVEPRLFVLLDDQIQSIRRVTVVADVTSG